MNTYLLTTNAIRTGTVPSTGLLGLLLIVVIVIIVLLSRSTRAAALGYTKAE
jgi:hypothetical protein